MLLVLQKQQHTKEIRITLCKKAHTIKNQKSHLNNTHTHTYIHTIRLFQSEFTLKHDAKNMNNIYTQKSKMLASALYVKYALHTKYHFF